MKIIKTTKDEKYLIIETDKGKLKCKLTFSGVDKLYQKCLRLSEKGCLVDYTTFGNWDRNKWFSDIWEVDKDGNRILEQSETWKSSSNITLTAFREQSASQPTIAAPSPQEKNSEPQSIQRVIGPPGTGKTTYLIKEEVGRALKNGTKPDKIAFLGFTNAATKAATDRLKKEFMPDEFDDFPYFRTLHSLATRLGGTLGRTIMQDSDKKKFDKNIKIQKVWREEGDIASIIDRPQHPILDEWSLSLAREEEFVPDKLCNLGPSPILRSLLEEFFKRKISIEQVPKFIKSYIKAYLDFKDKEGLVDFDDVIINAVDKLNDADFPEFDLLIIDEAQDLSSLQWRFVKRLCVKCNRIVLAGDDDQAIMVDFGAAPKQFLDFTTTEPDHALNQSHRVPPQIIEYVKRNILPKLKSYLPDRLDREWFSSDKLKGGEVKTQYLDNSEIKETEKDYDLTTFIREVSRRQREDWLLLAPTHASVKTISEALEHEKVPHFQNNEPILGAIPKDKRIRTQTIHTAKGLEADNVALIRLSKADDKMLNGNPRLEYVALTRAKKELFPHII